jgi:hypothetical protein
MLILFWGLVTAPLCWGLWVTLQQSWILFG